MGTEDTAFTKWKTDLGLCNPAHSTAGLCTYRVLAILSVQFKVVSFQILPFSAMKLPSAVTKMASAS